jgi:hypothetical protein
MVFGGVARMALTLREDTSSPVGFTSGLRVDDLTWWFWVKAGIGFSTGAAVVTLIGMVLWIKVLAVWYLRLALRGF